MSKLSVAFTALAWEDYLYWQANDKQTLKRINLLINDMLRTPFSGIGKPEALKYELAGTWSRRINSEHRLIYLLDKNLIRIIACRYHYGKN